MLVRIAATSYVGDQRFWRMSRHNSPLAYTLGWNILLRNLTVGGLFGYDSSNVNSSLNVPSSNGVSACAQVSQLSGADLVAHSPGPNMTAFHSMRLSLHGAPDMPCGGSAESFLKSRINLRLQGAADASEYDPLELMCKYSLDMNAYYRGWVGSQVNMVK